MTTLDFDRALEIAIWEHMSLYPLPVMLRIVWRMYPSLRKNVLALPIPGWLNHCMDNFPAQSLHSVLHKFR